VEVMAALVGLYCYKKYKHTAVKYFIWFLVYVALVELIGAYPRHLRTFEFLNPIETFLKGGKFEKNYWWFTVCWNMGSAFFYSFYFRKLIHSKKYVKLLSCTTIAFAIFCVAYIVMSWERFFIASFPAISISGATLIFLSIVLYLIEILQSDRILSFYQSINFYISTVLLVWFLVITPLVFYQVYYSLADWNFIFLRWQIYLTMNIFMYSTFTFTLLWCKPQNN